MAEYKYEFVKVRVRDGIAWAFLNRPDKRNAMSPQLHYDMDDALVRLREEEKALLPPGDGLPGAEVEGAGALRRGQVEGVALAGLREDLAAPEVAALTHQELVVGLHLFTEGLARILGRTVRLADK